MKLPVEILSLIALFAPLFSDRVFQHAQLLIIGAILAPSSRTVTSALRMVGLKDDPHWTNFHRVLNRDSWSPLNAAKILFGLIITLIPTGSPIILAADDTIERRGGRRITAKGCYRDAVRSSKSHVVRCFGLKWVSMMLLVPLPFSSRVWALPFLTALVEPKPKSDSKKSKKRSNKKSKKKAKRPAPKNRRKTSKATYNRKANEPKHKSSIDFVRQMMKLVRRWVPDRMMVLVVDGGFAALSLALACLGNDVVMVSRLRIDAQLYDKPLPQPAGKRGPKPKKGKRLPSPKARAESSDTKWEETEIIWYGGKKKKLKVFTDTALWYTAGYAPVEIRYCVVRDPEGKLRDEAFFCTKLEASVKEILSLVIKRWSVEVTFEESRAHLGVETQRQWSEKAIKRTTPALLGLFSLVTVMAMRISEGGKVEAEQAAWYKKEEATFSDCIREVRKRIIEERYYVRSEEKGEMVELPREALELILYALPLAA